MQARQLPSESVTCDVAAPVGIACTHRPARRIDLGAFPMPTNVHADQATDHPTRDPADHANLDPRRTVKHPKVAQRSRSGADRPGRG
jgi:hypothetical protein